MELPPGYRWVDSPKGGPRPRGLFLLPIGFFVAFEGELLALSGSASFVRGMMFAPVHGSLSDSFLIYFVAAVSAAMLLLLGLLRPTSRIGVGELGVALVAGSRVRIVAWEELRPSPVSPAPSDPWAAFDAFDPRGRSSRGFVASKEQTRLILGHRRFPAQDFPGGYWTWLGLTDPYGIPPAEPGSRPPRLT